MLKSLMDKSEFLGLDQCTWLYSGAETPPHRAIIEAMTNYFTQRSKGPKGREHNTEVEENLKKNLAALLKGSIENISLLSNASEVISMIAQSLDWQPGDNVVVNTLEFPSGVLPWLQLKKDQGVEVRVVPHQDWQLTPENILTYVDDRTRLVIVSHVSFHSGARIDYKELYAQLKHTQAYLLLDVTQSLGAVPVDMNHADFVVSSSYKWLMSTHGAGILAVNPERADGLSSRAVGWRSVEDLFSVHRFDSFEVFKDSRRFELGFPSYPTLYTMNASTKLLLEVGIENIERHILALGDVLISELKRIGYEVMTPAEPSKRAGNISIVCPDGERVASSLADSGVYVWGGDGRLRISVHLFNDSSDITTIITLLSSIKSYKS